MINSLKKILPGNLSRVAKKLYLNLRGIYYKGTNFHCPICNGNYSKMLPGGFDLKVVKEKEIIGSGLRDNNICPYCQSTDRDRLVYSYLSNYTNFFSEKTKVLHVSPEPSLYNILRKYKNIKYITGTKYSEGVYYHKGIDSIDLLKLPYENNEFDMILCNHVLEHIIEDTLAMSEIYRVLKPGGKAILQVPISYKIGSTYEDNSIISEKEREEHFGQFDHVRIYGKDYIDRLKKTGFIVDIYDPNKEKVIVNKDNKLALNLKEKLFVAKKDI